MTIWTHISYVKKVAGITLVASPHHLGFPRSSGSFRRSCSWWTVAAWRREAGLAVGHQGLLWKRRETQRTKLHCTWGTKHKVQLENMNLRKEKLTTSFFSKIKLLRWNRARILKEFPCANSFNNRTWSRNKLKEIWG